MEPLDTTDGHAHYGPSEKLRQAEPLVDDRSQHAANGSAEQAGHSAINWCAIGSWKARTGGLTPRR